MEIWSTVINHENENNFASGRLKT